MKKIFFYVAMCILFFSLIATLTQNQLVVVDLNKLLNIFVNAPSVDFSGIYSTFISMSDGFLTNIPFIGFIFSFVLNVGVCIVMICEFIIKILTFVVYLIPTLFGVV